MAWLDTNEYLLLETVGRDRVDDITRTARLVRTRGERPQSADVTRHGIRKRAPRLAGRLMCFLLSPG
jgi:hypothetical protein